MKTFLFVFVAAVLSLSAIPAAAAEKTPASLQAEAQVAHGININTSDVQTLAQLKGVGVKKAEAIVAWREANGRFVSVEQLLEVKGIGEAILAANRDRLSI